MSLKDDLKRVFFGAKAVAKSAADKAAEAAKEAGGDLADKGSVLFDKASARASELGDELLENTAEARAKAKDTLSDISDRVWDETQHAMDKGRELKQKATDWLADEPAQEEKIPTPPPPATPKAASGPIDFEADVAAPNVPREPGAIAKAGSSALDAAARTGAQALDAASVAGKKVMDVSEDVGEKVMDIGGKILGKAKELGGDLANKAADMVERAQDAADRESLQSVEEKAAELARQAQERADNALKNTKETLLDGKDDFFAKADRFARGDYHNEGGKEMTIKKDEDYVAPKRSGKAAGFEDLDGDGDELIDDAVIDEE
ncbi:MAG: hypothetical protein DA408_16900 [Bacteroidetes bacterium]|nr:MAG: hypothetical protein C7N36_19170 [Bacteroidota bacterium]PTM10046.1 MAG: hypothetical protein DA408_16900 [Bacteroidota bacterium]